MMTCYAIAFLTLFFQVSEAQMKIDINVSNLVAPRKMLETCICNAIVSEVNGVNSCQFESIRRLISGAEGEDEAEGEVVDEAEGEDEAERNLQGGSCANCNPGPSGMWCRWMHCRRRLRGAAGYVIPLADVQMDIEVCLGTAAMGQVGVDLSIAAAP
jgi:hypothetical protein